MKDTNSGLSLTPPAAALKKGEWSASLSFSLFCKSCGDTPRPGKGRLPFAIPPGKPIERHRMAYAKLF